MLDAFIVEWLRRERQRQEQSKKQPEQPRVELPVQIPEEPSSDHDTPEGSEDVIVVVNL